MIPAIQCAYQDAKLLHRDISMGNIMLDSNMNGFLNDWDRGIRLSASEEARATRTVCLFLALFYVLTQFTLLSGHMAVSLYRTPRVREQNP